MNGIQARAGYCTSRCKFYYVWRLAVKGSGPVQHRGERLAVRSPLLHDGQEAPRRVGLEAQPRTRHRKQRHRGADREWRSRPHRCGHQFSARPDVEQLAPVAAPTCVAAAANRYARLLAGRRKRRDVDVVGPGDVRVKRTPSGRRATAGRFLRRTPSPSRPAGRDPSVRHCQMSFRQRRAARRPASCRRRDIGRLLEKSVGRHRRHFAAGREVLAEQMRRPPVSARKKTRAAVRIPDRPALAALPEGQPGFGPRSRSVSQRSKAPACSDRTRVGGRLGDSRGGSGTPPEVADRPRGGGPAALEPGQPLLVVVRGCSSERPAGGGKTGEAGGEEIRELGRRFQARIAARRRLFSASNRCASSAPSAANTR